MQETVNFQNSYQNWTSDTYENNVLEESAKFEVIQQELNKNIPQKQQTQSNYIQVKENFTNDLATDQDAIEPEKQEQNESQISEPILSTIQKQTFEEQTNLKSESDKFQNFSEIMTEQSNKTSKQSNYQNDFNQKNKSGYLFCKKNMHEIMPDDTRRRKSCTEAFQVQSPQYFFENLTQKNIKSSSQKNLKSKQKQAIETSQIQSENSQFKMVKSLSYFAAGNFSDRLYNDFKNRQVKKQNEYEQKILEEENKIQQMLQHQKQNKNKKLNLNFFIFKHMNDADCRKKHRENLSLQKTQIESQIATIMSSTSFTNKKSKKILEKNDLMKLPAYERFSIQIKQRQKSLEDQKKETMSSIKKRQQFKALAYNPKNNPKKISQQVKNQKILNAPKKQNSKFQKRLKDSKQTNQKKEEKDQVKLQEVCQQSESDSQIQINLDQNQKKHKKKQKSEMILKKQQHKSGQSNNKHKKMKSLFADQFQESKIFKHQQKSDDELQKQIFYSKNIQRSQQTKSSKDLEASCQLDFQTKQTISKNKEQIENKSDKNILKVGKKKFLKALNKYNQKSQKAVTQIKFQQLTSPQGKYQLDNLLIQSLNGIMNIQTNAKEQDQEKLQCQESMRENIVQDDKNLKLQQQEQQRKKPTPQCKTSQEDQKNFQVTSFQKQFAQSARNQDEQIKLINLNEFQTEKNDLNSIAFYKNLKLKPSSPENCSLNLKNTSCATYKYQPLEKKISQKEFHSLRKKL